MCEVPNAMNSVENNIDEPEPRQVPCEAPGCMAEQLEEARIKGRTEAMEFIYELVGVYRKNDMINAAEMLEREIDNFANC